MTQIIRKIRLHSHQAYKGGLTIVRFIRRFRTLGSTAILVNVYGAASGSLQILIPVAIAQLINRAIPEKNIHLLTIIACAVSFAALGSVFMSFCEAQSGSAFHERASIVIEMQLLEHIQGLPHQFFKLNDSAYIVSRLFNDAGTGLGVLSGLTTIGRMAAVLLGGFILLPAFDPHLGALIILAMPIYASLLLYFQSKTKSAYYVVSEATAQASKELFESVLGIYETKAYCAEKHRLRRYLRDVTKRARATVKARALLSAAGQVSQVISFLFSICVIVYGGAEVIAGRLSLGNMVAINATVGYLIAPIGQIVQQVLAAQTSLAAIERVDQWMAIPHELDCSPDVSLSPFRGSIRYKNVAFAYSGREPVFQNINLTVAPGEVILIAGQSGAGKSTLVSLLPRFLEPCAGSIYVDDTAITTIPLRRLRRLTSFVSQDTFLFSESITENIRMGKASVSEADVYEAARLANALEFINALPEKFRTQVGERGARLSGGERQRIAIARAIVHDAPILILDEATSAVDRDTEAAVHEALRRLMKGRTTVIVAHHYDAFIDQIDRCYTLEDGCLREADASTLRDTERIKSLSTDEVTCMPCVDLSGVRG